MPIIVHEQNSSLNSSPGLFSCYGGYVTLSQLRAEV